MRRVCIIATVFLLAAGSDALRAAATNATSSAPSRLTFDAFRIISDRNIFNPNRYPGSDNRNTRREPDRRTQSESFALVGTMSSEKGRFAFFDGSNSDYKRVLGTNDQIAGYTIAEVTPDHVSLQSTNQEIKLPVGMQMKRFEEGQWELTARTESSGTASPASSSSNGTTSSSGGADDDVLKRMMQRREQEGGAGASQATPEPPRAPSNTERTPEPSGPEADILKRLQQQREQELNK